MTCEEKLEQAEKALHELLLHGGTVQVWDGDFRVQYSGANLSDLQAYVNRLLAECGPDAGCCGQTTRRAIRYRMS